MAHILTFIRGESGSGLTARNGGGASFLLAEACFSSPCKSCYGTDWSYLLPSSLIPGYSCSKSEPSSGTGSQTASSGKRLQTCLVCSGTRERSMSRAQSEPFLQTSHGE